MPKPKSKYSRWSKRIERNILAVYSRRTAIDEDHGLHWYSIAHQECSAMAERYGLEFWQSVGVVAGLSPGLPWGRNVIEADELMACYTKGLEIPILGVYGKGNVNKVVRILKGEDPMDVFPEKTSPKVRAFFNCILDPWESEAVCVDRHAKGLAYNLGSNRRGSATNDKLSNVRPREYEYLAWHYRVIAERLGLIPNQLQAITWVVWKRIEGDLEKEEVPF